ncbi:MAG: ABC transporter ATP-binding protein [Deltaproteobacteria bacterium]|nr:MAG: ABC transporter ATP-binding protein [Deltaproteobacteria bacterium]
MLHIEDLYVKYGEIEAIRSLTLEVRREEIATLIGAKGAGKTTLLRTISGLKRPFRGRILFEGSRIDTLQPSMLPRMGIAHVPEGRHVFHELSVLDNLYLGAYSAGSTRKAKEELSRVFSLFPILRGRSRQTSATLSGGEQQILVIARALMGRPRLLLLDEPSLGLSPLFVQNIFLLIDRIRKEGLTILLVEQNARMALKYADRGYVIETGRIVMEDEARELLTNARLKEWYLGGS